MESFQQSYPHGFPHLIGALSTDFSTKNTWILTLDLLDHGKNFRLCVLSCFQINFHLVDGGHDRGMVTVKNLRNGLQRQIGQISRDVNRHVSCLRNIILSFLGFEILGAQAAFLCNHG